MKNDQLEETSDSEWESRRASRRGLGWLLDSSIPLPGGFRIGLDGLIGLIPGVGDAIGGGLSGWILYQGYKLGVPRMVLARMVINVFIDAVLGAIPFIGDLFDFFWKANLKNLRLLESYQQAPERTYRRSVASTAVFFVGVIVIVGLMVYLTLALVALVWQALFQN